MRNTSAPRHGADGDIVAKPDESVDREDELHWPNLIGAELQRGRDDGATARLFTVCRNDDVYIDTLASIGNLL